jgi:hypothetical protein
MPALFCCAGWQSQGIQPTVTRPGSHGWEVAIDADDYEATTS